MAYEFPKVGLFMVGRDLAGRFVSMETHIVEQMRQTLTRETQILANQVKTNIAARVRNPALMQGAVGMSPVRQQGAAFVAEVDVSGTYTGRRLPFMRIQEEGGTVRIPRISKPFKRGTQQAMHFPGAKYPFAAAKAHNVRIPPRSYLRLALEQRQAAIDAGFKLSINRAVEES